MTSEDMTPPGSDRGLLGYTGHLMKRAFLHVHAHGADAMPIGRHPREIGVLLLLIHAGPLSQARVGALLDISRTDMVKVVDGLETPGYVVRERDPADRRRYALRATEAGERACEELRAAADEAERAAFACLSADERARLVPILLDLIPDLRDALPAELLARTGFLIARCHHRLRRRGEQRLASRGLRPRHFGLLTALASAEPCSQQRLAGLMGVSGPAIIQSIDELERAGVIRRDRNPDDRREHLLLITPDGRRRHREARDDMDDFQRELVIEIGAERIAELNRLLLALIPSEAPTPQRRTP
ncbi:MULTISPECIES: MarR family winged helix-turn-helix transcriptional regulator [Actinomadura]|uniref:MarR family transcriptional regulator n=1 Tax=Actinomadura litoris TaxID=2678616 RepID=A0A7K1KSJ5_9ACTN|nr:MULTISPECIES: MarR family transcriptional regulator [Actinomadura]MBT2208007.1 MarR family transcriptional regulator [Actinomadura sp. NEAU-AAG7]MUN35150.1 MarR family transcriptional regulator [Actinomadura litoris]